MKNPLLSVLLLAAALAIPGCSTPEPKPAAAAIPDDVRSYLDVLRSDFNASKIRTLNEVMKLTPEEADRFWPVYRSYEQELAAVGDRKLVLIREFMQHQEKGTFAGADANRMAHDWLQNAQDRLDLWKKYQARISTAVSPVRAAQFLQVENQMAIFLDLGVASGMPVIGSAPPAH